MAVSYNKYFKIILQGKTVRQPALQPVIMNSFKTDLGIDMYFGTTLRALCSVYVN